MLAQVIPCLVVADDARTITNTEMLAHLGFSSDDAGLVAAAQSGQQPARTLAFWVACDRNCELLVDDALAEIATSERALAPNYRAGQYLIKMGREEGFVAIRQIAALPDEDARKRPDGSLALRAVELLGENGDESFVSRLTECLRREPYQDDVTAVQVLGSFHSPANPAVEDAWIAAAEHMTVLLQSEDPNDQSGAWLYATWLNASARKQSMVTQRIKDAFDAISLPVNRGDELARVAASLDSARAHWATCELVPSEEPPPADPPPGDPE